LFRRVDAMVGDVLPEGYSFDVDHNAVAHAVLGKSTWAVLALTLDIELFTQLHYRESIDPDTQLSDLFLKRSPTMTTTAVLQTPEASASVTGHAFQDQIPNNFCYGCGPGNPVGLHIRSIWAGNEAL